MLCAARYLVKPGGLDWPKCKFPSHSAPTDKIPGPNNPPYLGVQVQLLLVSEQQVLAFCQPMELFEQVNRILP